MSKHSDQDSKELDSADLDGDGIEELLRQVGGRSEPSLDLMNEVRGAVHAEWQEVVRARKRQQRVVAFAMAAGIASVALVATFVLRTTAPASVQVATVMRIDGRMQTVGDDAHDVAVGDRLATGQTLHTDAQSRVALDFGRGLAVRIDASSTFKLAAVDRVALDAGALYIDAVPNPQGPIPLNVDTVAGSVRHLGTQYQVRALNDGSSGDSIEVSVREGRVEVSGAHGTNVGEAGEQLRLSTSGDVRRSRIAATDASWQWASQAAPVFQIADQPLSAFLNWAARETGRKLVYRDSQAQALADSVRLRGTIEGLDAETALAAVLPTTSLRRYETKDESIEIGVAAPIERSSEPRPNP
jgi:hypothetical protein